MNSLFLEKDLVEMTDFFGLVMRMQHYMMVWQVIGGQRIINVLNLNSIDEAKHSLELKFSAQSEIELNPSNKAFCYISMTQTIFKTVITKYDDSGMRVSYPDELKLLDDEQVENMEQSFSVMNDYHFVKGYKYVDPKFDIVKVRGIASSSFINNRMVGKISDISSQYFETKVTRMLRSQHDHDLFADELRQISLDEEDLIFEESRSTPRSKPKEGKTVIMARQGNIATKANYKLYDLSQGGMSVLCLDENEFQRGVQIHVLGFDDRRFDQPMLAEVMSVRPVDEFNVQFKVGMKFNT